jgi:Transposase DDE domain
MNIKDLLLETYCWVDDQIKGWLGDSLRARGPRPTLRDSEVITLEIVGEFLGWDQDRQLFERFRAYHAAEFPLLRSVHRTTFVRQAAALWWVKAQLCQRLSQALVGANPDWLVDSLPLAVCQFARAKRCRRFAGQAAFGRDGLSRGTYYGFRFHLRVSAEGIIAQLGLAPANVSDLAMAEELLPAAGGGRCLGDRNYWSPDKQAALAGRGWQLWAPFRQASKDPAPERSKVLGVRRRRIETTFGQLSERFHLKRVWARDLWHLCHRLIRKVLSHTFLVWLNVQAGLPPLRLAALLEA